MVKKLTKYGNGLALVIDCGVPDLLTIDAETPLNIRTDDKCLIVTRNGMQPGKKSSARRGRG